MLLRMALASPSRVWASAPVPIREAERIREAAATRAYREAWILMLDFVMESIPWG
jgi:hypothetical protein